MAETKIKYAATAAITVTAWDSLGTGAYAVSAQVDNTSNLYMDVLVGGVLATDNTLFPDADDTFDLYVVATYSDTDTDVTSALDATGAIGTTSEVLTEGIAGEFIKENMIFLGSVSMSDTDMAAAEFVHFGPFSIAEVFGGIMPRKWAIVLHNTCAVGVLETTGTTLDYTGITFTSL